MSGPERRGSVQGKARGQAVTPGLRNRQRQQGPPQLGLVPLLQARFAHLSNECMGRFSKPLPGMAFLILGLGEGRASLA